MKFSHSVLAASETRTQRGNVAIIFAIVSSVSLCVLGATIELNRIATSRATLAAAADAGALAAKREQSGQSQLGQAMSRSLGESAGNRAFRATAPGDDKGVSDLRSQVTWDPDGSARLTATGTQTLIFGGFLGRSTVPLTAVGVAAAGTDRKLEIVVLMDTTASMFQKDDRSTTRFTQMRGAAKDFVNTLFNTMTVPDHMRIAVIPWTTTVNIRGEVPDQVWNNAPAPMRSPADAGTGILPRNPINRSVNVSEDSSQLDAMYAPVSWRGCISGNDIANGESLTANDDVKAGMRWNALAVPPKITDAKRVKGVASTKTCYRSTGCSPPPPASPRPYSPPPPPTQGKLFLPGKKPESFAFLGFGKSMTNAACVSEPYTCAYNLCDTNSPSVTTINCSQNFENGKRNSFFNFRGSRACVNGGGCQLDLQLSTAEGCVSDYNEIAWNTQGGKWCNWITKYTWDAFRPISGPNLNCPMPMLGLSANRTQLIDTIDRLSPAPGGTHADVGLRWGLRALSPRPQWASFFKHEQPEPFQSPTATKVMVLMTDGANEQAINFPGYWGCSDPNAPGCTGSPDRAMLDSRMQTWCTSIRETYKVELYTVAINISDADAVSRLRTCAGDPKRAFAVDASELSATFEEIARETFNLRLKE